MKSILLILVAVSTLIAQKEFIPSRPLVFTNATRAAGGELLFEKSHEDPEQKAVKFVFQEPGGLVLMATTQGPKSDQGYWLRPEKADEIKIEIWTQDGARYQAKWDRVNP